MGTVEKSRILVMDDNYSEQTSVKLDVPAYLINACFAKGDESPRYVFVQVNTNDGVYEPGNRANNIAEKAVTFSKLNVDLSVEEETGDEIGSIGRPFNIGWTVANLGQVQSSGYEDAVYFSKDPVLNANAVSAFRMSYGALGVGASKVNNRTITVPKLETGDY